MTDPPATAACPPAPSPTALDLWEAQHSRSPPRNPQNCPALLPLLCEKRQSSPLDPTHFEKVPAHSAERLPYLHTLPPSGGCWWAEGQLVCGTCLTTALKKKREKKCPELQGLTISMVQPPRQRWVSCYQDKLSAGSWEERCTTVCLESQLQHLSARDEHYVGQIISACLSLENFN